ncbi:MAG: hypothetical protein H0T51_10690 [Pirellulales bacterium]|nr:hypothetical protein [Pirellulales bacterium]
MNRFTATPLCVAILAIALGSTAVAQTVAADEAPADFRSLLLEAGFSAEELAAFADWSGELSEAQADVASRLLFRLRAAGEGLVASDRHDVEPGQLVMVEGRVVSATLVELPGAAREILEQKQLTVCRVKLADGLTVVVLSMQVPTAWSRRPPGTPLDEPVKLRGVSLGTATLAGKTNPLVLARRLQWFPDANVSAGVSWLVHHGFDAALLDEVRHGQPFTRLSESLEAKAFYEILAIVAQCKPAELALRVRELLPAVEVAAKLDAAQAAAKRRELADEWKTASAATRELLRSEIANTLRRQATADHVAKRAKSGLSSIWPIVLDPERSTGDLFLIEGTARRAVRIVVDDPSGSEIVPAKGDVRGDSQEAGLREYYELDVFTTDFQSQPAYKDQPVICCVARLPEGFPTGELIREPVRVAGIFFKKWAYARRSDDEDETGDNRLPTRLAPPLMLAAEPEWLQAAAPAGPSHRGLWGGAAFAGIVAFLWIVLARVSRRDRLARAQRARYDASLENLAEL